jgi:hypothetical protein
MVNIQEGLERIASTYALTTPAITSEHGTLLWFLLELKNMSRILRRFIFAFHLTRLISPSDLDHTANLNYAINSYCQRLAYTTFTLPRPLAWE